MLSIIVCSIDPDRLEQFKTNIAETIDKNAVYEIIAIDNRNPSAPIAAVYNEGARRAKYENLLFIHEDAGFRTKGWLSEIEAQLATPDCGVIGFAGTRVMLNVPGGWGMDYDWIITNFESGAARYSDNCDPGIPFREVVALDGYALFVRKKVWEDFPFDENILVGFHCYDVDFTLSVSGKYVNYVCCNILTYHESQGNFDKIWAHQTMEIYDKKWKAMLPRFASDVVLTPTQISYLEERACFRLIKRFSKMGYSSSKLAKRFLKYPLKPRHLEHLLKYVTYEVKRISGI